MKNVESNNVITVNDRDVFSDLVCNFETLGYAIDNLFGCENDEMFYDIIRTYRDKINNHIDNLAVKLG